MSEQQQQQREAIRKADEKLVNGIQQRADKLRPAWQKVVKAKDVFPEIADAFSGQDRPEATFRIAEVIENLQAALAILEALEKDADFCATTSQ